MARACGYEPAGGLSPDAKIILKNGGIVGRSFHMPFELLR